jgi:hypothetical protein
LVIKVAGPDSGGEGDGVYVLVAATLALMIEISVLPPAWRERYELLSSLAVLVSILSIILSALAIALLFLG